MGRRRLACVFSQLAAFGFPQIVAGALRLCCSLFVLRRCGRFRSRTGDEKNYSWQVEPAKRVPGTAVTPRPPVASPLGRGAGHPRDSELNGAEVHKLLTWPGF